MSCCGIRKDKFGLQNREPIENIDDRIWIETSDTPADEVQRLQLELAETYREISLLTEDTNDINRGMLSHLLNTHKEEDSERLLSDELAAVCTSLSIQLSQLQQTEREIIRIEHHLQQIETRARDEYKTCQEHIMKYAKENNRFLLRITQLEELYMRTQMEVQKLEAAFQFEITMTFDFQGPEDDQDDSSESETEEIESEINVIKEERTYKKLLAQLQTVDEHALRRQINDIHNVVKKKKKDIEIAQELLAGTNEQIELIMLELKQHPPIERDAFVKRQKERQENYDKLLNSKALATTVSVHESKTVNATRTTPLPISQRSSGREIYSYAE